MYKRLIVAVDGSEGATKAIQTAIEISAVTSAVVTALYAFEPPAFLGEMMAGSEICAVGGLDPSIFDELRDQQTKRVREIVESSFANSGIRYEYRLEVGQPAHTIVRIAEEHHCDLIVIGSRGLSGIKSLLLGSVSERVAHLAHCSVLITR